MESQPEKRMAENYEITQAVYIGDKEEVMGMDETKAMPYFCAFYSCPFMAFPIIKIRAETGTSTGIPPCPVATWTIWNWLSRKEKRWKADIFLQQQ